MPRLADADQSLLEPPTPPTDIRGAHLDGTGDYILEEFSDRPEAWYCIDSEHVYPLEAME